MKKLNNRYKRNLKSSLSFYISLSFLTCVTVLMYLLFSSAVHCEDIYVQNFFDESNVEDGQFTTYRELSNEDIEELEKDYDVLVERQNYVNLEEGNYTVRLFSFTEKINIPEVTAGEAPKDNDEICLTQSFAEANNVEIGNNIILNGKKYRVTGFAERPDYLYMIENQSDSYHRAAEFGLGFVTRTELESFEDGAYYYSVTYDEDNREEFRKHLNDVYRTLSYMTAETNHRISTPKATIVQFEIITGVILPALLVLVIAVIAVVLGRKVKAEKKHIGTLTALGYRKNEIAMHYAWYAIIPGVAGEILGLVLAFILVKPMAGAIFFKLEKLPVIYTVDWLNVILAMIIPVAAYTITAILSVLRILKMSVTDMLSGRSNKGKESRLLVQSEMNFKRKFRIRTLLNNYVRTLVAILGIVISGLIMCVGIMMHDSCRNYEDNVIDDIGTFNYEYLLNGLTYADQDGEKLLSATFEVEGSDNSVMLMGLDKDNRYINLHTIDDKEADIDGKYYISSMASEIFGVDKGDTFTVYDTATLEKYDIKISGIINNKAQSVIYSSAETVAGLLGIEDGQYNVIISDKKLDIDESFVNSTIKKETMKNMIRNVISGTKILIYLMIIFGFLICSICVYLMVNMIIEENAVTISMLKVLGYYNKEINKITINIYHILVPIGIVLSLIGGWFITWEYFDSSTASFQAQIPVYLSVEGLIFFVAVVVISYIISLLLLGRKVRNVDMSDSLKSIRE